MQIISYFLLLAWREGQTDNKQGLGEKGNLRGKKRKRQPHPSHLGYDELPGGLLSLPEQDEPR